LPPEPEELDTSREVAQQAEVEPQQPQAQSPEQQAGPASPQTAGGETQPIDAPFDMQVGQDISKRRYDPEPDTPGRIAFHPDGMQAGLMYMEEGPWRLRGVDGAFLRVTVPLSSAGTPGRPRWVDQPFEVLKDGRLVASFSNTAEYQRALQ
jgi:hypothetical protein